MIRKPCDQNAGHCVPRYVITSNVYCQKFVFTQSFMSMLCGMCACLSSVAINLFCCYFVGETSSGKAKGDYFVPWHVPFHRADAASALKQVWETFLNPSYFSYARFFRCTRKCLLSQAGDVTIDVTFVDCVLLLLGLAKLSFGLKNACKRVFSSSVPLFFFKRSMGILPSKILALLWCSQVSIVVESGTPSISRPFTQLFYCCEQVQESFI